MQVRKLVDLFVLLWSTVILQWEPYLYRTGRGVIMCKAERKENIFSPFKIKVKIFPQNTALRNTILRRPSRWLGPVVTNFLCWLKTSLEAKGKPWLVPYSGSEKCPFREDFVNAHMKIRHHGQSGFAGSAGKESRSLQLFYSFPMRCFSWQGKAWKHVHTSWGSDPLIEYHWEMCQT